MSGDDLLLAYIKEAINNGRYFFTTHALTNHPPMEGFTERDALESIENGSIIEHREGESRCLISGPATSLEQSHEYITNYIHCVCRYDSITRIVIVTMYRPSSNEWINPFSRRKS